MRQIQLFLYPWQRFLDKCDRRRTFSLAVIIEHPGFCRLLKPFANGQVQKIPLETIYELVVLYLVWSIDELPISIGYFIINTQSFDIF